MKGALDPLNAALRLSPPEQLTAEDDEQQQNLSFLHTSVNMKYAAEDRAHLCGLLTLCMHGRRVQALCICSP